MHLVYLGLMRRLLHLWINGPRNIKIGQLSINEISTLLVRIAPHMPIEINRKPRPLQDLERFKATEFRTFLLYTGIVVLKDVLNYDLFKNFVLLSFAINLMDKSNIENSLQHARLYLCEFLRNNSSYYMVRITWYTIYTISVI